MIEGLASALKETAKEVTKSVKDIMPDFFKDMEYNKGIDVNAPVDVKNNDLETKNPLTDEQKEQIREESGYSDEVIDNISCWEEYEVYRDSGLVEVEIDGEKCLIRSDIDFNQKDSMGRTNGERIEQGLSPINKDGKVIELHHIGQHQDSPLAELTTQEHRGKGNDTILHDKSKESEIDRGKFGNERNEYWEARLKCEGGNA